MSQITMRNVNFISVKPDPWWEEWRRNSLSIRVHGGHLSITREAPA